MVPAMVRLVLPFLYYWPPGVDLWRHAQQGDHVWQRTGVWQDYL